MIFNYTTLTWDELVNKIGVSRFFNLPKMVEEALKRLKALISANEPKYKVYTALLSQEVTDAPTAIILENTLGDITLSSSDGIYNTATSNGLFTDNKTFVFLGNGNDSAYTPQYIVEDTSTISFNVSLSEDAMDNTPIEIRVYN